MFLPLVDLVPANNAHAILQQSPCTQNAVNESHMQNLDFYIISMSVLLRNLLLLVYFHRNEHTAYLLKTHN